MGKKIPTSTYCGERFFPRARRKCTECGSLLAASDRLSTFSTPPWGKRSPHFYLLWGEIFSQGKAKMHGMRELTRCKRPIEYIFNAAMGKKIPTSTYCGERFSPRARRKCTECGSLLAASDRLSTFSTPPWGKRSPLLLIVGRDFFPGQGENARNEGAYLL